MSLTVPLPLSKTIVLVGLMGSGKSTIGCRLAKRLNVAFTDTDHEIEHDVGCSVSDIFAGAGEAYFRECERKTVAELLTRPPHVMATGGGAFIQATTRAVIAEKAISVWLQADIEVLLERVSRKRTRPLLEMGDKREILTRLIAERYPIYALADITINSGNRPHTMAVEAILQALTTYQHKEPA